MKDKKAYILSVASHQPPEEIANKELLSTSKILQRQANFAEQFLGISHRYWVPQGESSYPLAKKAALEALAKCPDIEIGKIIYLLAGVPGHHDKKKFNRPQRLQKDLTDEDYRIRGNIGIYGLAECTSYVSALHLASLYAKNSTNTLIVTDAFHSSFLDQKSLEYLIFGDMFTATIVGHTNNRSTQPVFEILEYYENGYGENWDIAYFEENIPGQYYIRHEAKRIKEFIPGAIEEGINGLIHQNNIKLNQIDGIIPHQANRVILEQFCKNHKIPIEKVYFTVRQYGNTGVSSIPHAFAHAIDNNYFQEKELIALVGFGTAGVSSILLKKYN